MTPDPSPVRYYTPSSSIAPLGVLFATVAGLLCAAILAPIYAFAIVHIPYVVLNVLLTMLFGGGTGAAVAYALHAGHVQNVGFSWVASMAAVVFAYWMHWVFWILALTFEAGEEVSILALLLPPILLEIIGGAYEFGTWGVSDEPLSGFLLAIVWLIEAALYFVSAGAAISIFVGSGTHCQDCKGWCKIMPKALLAIDMTGQIIERVAAGDWHALNRPPPHPQQQQWNGATVHRCERCGVTHTLTLTNETRKVDSKGNASSVIDIKVDRIYIPSNFAAAVLDTEARRQVVLADSEPGGF